MQLFRRGDKKQEVDVDVASVADDDDDIVLEDDDVESVVSAQLETNSIRSSKKHLTSPSFQPYDEHETESCAVISLCRTCAEQLVSPAISRAPTYEPVRSSAAATLLSQSQTSRNKNKVDLTRVKTQLPSSSRRSSSRKVADVKSASVSSDVKPTSISDIKIKQESSESIPPSSSKLPPASPLTVPSSARSKREDSSRSSRRSARSERDAAPVDVPVPASEPVDVPVPASEPVQSSKSSFTVHRSSVKDVVEEEVRDALLREFTRADGSIDRQGLDDHMKRLRCELVSASDIRYNKTPAV